MARKQFTTHEMKLVVDENDLLKKENLRLRREVSALQKRVTSLQFYDVEKADAKRKGEL